jgi:hypothetical protein
LDCFYRWGADCATVKRGISETISRRENSTDLTPRSRSRSASLLRLFDNSYGPGQTVFTRTWFKGERLPVGEQILHLQQLMLKTVTSCSKHGETRCKVPSYLKRRCQWWKIKSHSPATANRGVFACAMTAGAQPETSESG